jgi:hypothetical protein
MRESLSVLKGKRQKGQSGIFEASRRDTYLRQGVEAMMGRPKVPVEISIDFLIAGL